MTPQQVVRLRRVETMKKRLHPPPADPHLVATHRAIRNGEWHTTLMEGACAEQNLQLKRIADFLTTPKS